MCENKSRCPYIIYCLNNIKAMIRALFTLIMAFKLSSYYSFGLCSFTISSQTNFAADRTIGTPEPGWVELPAK